MTTPTKDSGETTSGLSRREALRLLAVNMTLVMSGCSKPERVILPYVDMPERVLPGEIIKFATTLSLNGYGRGVLVHSVDGRPIKIEGNPRHPASLGATDLFAEAAIFDLYDPQRSRTVQRAGDIASPGEFGETLTAELARLRETPGGVRLLTGPVTSPTLLRLIAQVLERYPGSRWHCDDPLAEPHRRAGARLAFGRDVQTIADFTQARTILSLGDDFLGPGPSQIRQARDWSRARKPSQNPDDLSRLYVVDSGLTLTGAKADHRLAVHPRDMTGIAAAIAHRLGADVSKPDLRDAQTRFVDACAQDLQSRRGLVLAGRGCRPEVHALAHWINARIGAPLQHLEPPADAPSPEGLEALAEDLHAGRVDGLFVFDANPVYDAPPSLRVAAGIEKARFSVHFGTFDNETARTCNWHAPLSHELESWLDLRAPGGAASLVQPLIRPLYGTRGASEWMAALLDGQEADGYALLRETWADAWGLKAGDEAFETRWRRALHDGIIPDTAFAHSQPGTPALPAIETTAMSRGADALTIVLAPDDCLFDGSRASNAWLQECPKPLTAQVWGHALAMSARDAKRLAVTHGSVVRLEASGETIEVLASVSQDMPDGVARLTLGYGREHAGAIGTGVGSNAYRLRDASGQWIIEGARLTATGALGEICETRQNVRLDGLPRELFPVLTTEQLVSGVSARAEIRKAKEKKTGETKTSGGKPASFYPEFAYEGHAWGMVIDTAACIGCNACVVACQAENNVPVVGPEEILRGRDMHWLRIDRYDHGPAEHPQPGFQPVPCMQCEKAPCEPVCPVEASVHDSEGLNVQVYNRCVGTRFCQANCPYKVRRFNFFGYADGQEYETLGADSLKAQHNPDVTVRARGVMEKCTYCVQRISRAKRDAQIDGREIEAGGVVTACQSACPTNAIHFGDLNGRDQSLRAAHEDPRHYALLEELGTQPRTTFLANIRNPNPKLATDDA